MKTSEFKAGKENRNWKLAFAALLACLALSATAQPAAAIVLGGLLHDAGGIWLSGLVNGLTGTRRLSWAFSRQR